MVNGAQCLQNLETNTLGIQYASCLTHCFHESQSCPLVRHEKLSKRCLVTERAFRRKAIHCSAIVRVSCCVRDFTRSDALNSLPSPSFVPVRLPTKIFRVHFHFPLLFIKPTKQLNQASSLRVSVPSAIARSFLASTITTNLQLPRRISSRR